MRWAPSFLAAGMLISSFAFGQTRTSDQQPADAAKLQQRAVARIERYIDHFRRTGDRATLIPELQQAERELTKSYELFVRAGDVAAAAFVHIKLAHTHRLQSRWSTAIAMYGEARREAARAGHKEYEATALRGLAMAQLSSKRFEDAAAAAEESVRLSEVAKSRSLLVAALTVRSEIESARGDQSAALRTIDQALSEAKLLNDGNLLMYAYLDRADYHVQRSSRCDYETTPGGCLQDLDRAKSDYQAAIGQARALRYESLVKTLESFLAGVDIRRSLYEHRAGFLAQIPTGLQILPDAREVKEGSPVSVTVSTINSRSEIIHVPEATVVTLESEHLATGIQVTIPAGRSSAQARIVFHRPGVARLTARAPRLGTAYTVVAVKRSTSAVGDERPSGMFVVRPVALGAPAALATSTDRVPRLSLEVLPGRVMPKQGIWNASVFVTALDVRGEPMDVAEDLTVRLAVTLGSIVPQVIVIKKGTSTYSEDIRVTATTPGTERVHAYAPRVAKGFEKQIQYDPPRPSRLLVHAAPSRAANSGRTPVEIVVILQDEHHNPAAFSDRPLPVALTSSLGTLSRHEGVILKGTTSAGPFVLRSARAGSAEVTARAEGLPESSITVTFEFPWLLVLIAALGGAVGVVLRSPRGIGTRQVWGHLAIGVLMGVVFFALALLGVTGTIPSVPLAVMENLALNEFGVFLLGLFGGYLGRKSLDKLLKLEPPGVGRVAN